MHRNLSGTDLLMQSTVTGFLVGMTVAVVMSVGCIIHQVPHGNLPLSADMCLNETYGIYNETMATVASLTTELQPVTISNVTDDSGVVR